MIPAIRSFGRHHPKIRAALRPIYPFVSRLLWVLRSRLFVFKPLAFSVGEHTISMVAKGQVAEYIWRGAFEAAEQDYASKAIRPGMRVLNIGANTGLYTLIASKKTGPSGIVHAFEPSTKTFAALKKNIELNGCKNVIANHIALSDFQGRLTLNRDPLHPELDGHFFVRDLSETLVDSPAPIEIVPCTTVDRYWRDACGGEIKPVDFIVIDVEGAELSVFQGARQTFEASSSLGIIMECTEHIPEITAILNDFDFSLYHWDLDSSRLVPAEIARGSFIALRKARHGGLLV